VVGTDERMAFELLLFILNSVFGKINIVVVVNYSKLYNYSSRRYCVVVVDDDTTFNYFLLTLWQRLLRTEVIKTIPRKATK